MATARCFPISSSYSLSQCFTSLRLCLPSCFTNSIEPSRENIFKEAFDEDPESNSGSDNDPEISITSVNENGNHRADDEIVTTYPAPVKADSKACYITEIKSIPVENFIDRKPENTTLLSEEQFKITPFIIGNNSSISFPWPIQVKENPSSPIVLTVKPVKSNSENPESESSFGAIQNNNTSTFPKIEGLECLSVVVSTKISVDSLSPRDTRESSWGLKQPIFVSPKDPWEFESEPFVSPNHLWGSELDPRQPAKNDCSLRIYSAFGRAGYNNPKDPADNGEVGRLNKPRPIESADMPHPDASGAQEIKQTQPQPKPQQMTFDEIRKTGEKSRNRRIANRDFFGMLSAESFNDFFQEMESEQDPKSFFEKLNIYVGAIGGKIIPSASTAPDEANQVSGGRKRR